MIFDHDGQWDGITVDQLRAFAEHIRSVGESTGYGYFPGGDPREFCPDPECSTEEERANHKRACELFENGKVDTVDGNHHWPIMNKEGEPIGWTTQSPFGLGTYSTTDPAAQDLANRLDAWLDDARKLEDELR